MTTRIKKAVIPVAGYGTRFLPITKTIPKEMLPIINRPIVEYIVREFVESGIEEIIFISSTGKHALEDYFDYNNELDYQLKAQGKETGFALSREAANMARFTYIRQSEQLGDGHALLLARDLIGNEPFAFAYGDDVYDAQVPAMAQMIETYLEHQGTVIGVVDVPREATSRYGVIDSEAMNDHTSRVRGTVEKPDPAVAPSTLAVAGRYLLTPSIFDALESLAQNNSGELRVTNAVNELAKRESVYARKIDGTYHDCGNILEYLKTVVHYGLKDPSIGNDLRDWLTNHLDQ